METYALAKKKALVIQPRLQKTLSAAASRYFPGKSACACLSSDGLNVNLRVWSSNSCFPITSIKAKGHPLGTLETMSRFVQLIGRANGHLTPNWRQADHKTALCNPELCPIHWRHLQPLV